MAKGKPTGTYCGVCKEEILSGQLVSGVAASDAPALNEDGGRISDEKYYNGHYACVLEALGPEETLKATREGRLPNLDPAVLIDGCLPTALGGL